MVENMEYSIGQRVKIITLIDGFGRRDPRVREYVGKTGIIVKAYYVS
jgi:ribosomal protein L21E